MDLELVVSAFLLDMERSINFSNFRTRAKLVN